MSDSNFLRIKEGVQGSLTVDILKEAVGEFESKRKILKKQKTFFFFITYKLYK